MKKAFTLIELIFVIVIIGLLAAVALPKFMTVTENAKIKPLHEVANQVVNKSTSRYQLIQDASIQNAINNDPDLKKTLANLVSNVDKHFKWDANDSVFQVTYDTNKTATSNTVDTTNTTIDNNTTTDVLCAKVERIAIQVPVTADANVTRYEYNVTEFNASCITAAP